MGNMRHLVNINVNKRNKNSTSTSEKVRNYEEITCFIAGKGKEAAANQRPFLAQPDVDWTDVKRLFFRRVYSVCMLYYHSNLIIAIDFMHRVNR